MTTTATQFSFQLEFVNDDNQVIRTQILGTKDFSHAIRHTRFDAFAQGKTETYLPHVDGAIVEPVFPSGIGPSPRASGFEVEVDLPGGAVHRCKFDIKYFAPAANCLRAELLRAEEMTTEQELFYRLNAFFDDQTSQPTTNKLNIALDPPEPITALDGNRCHFGPTHEWDNPEPSDMRVLIDHGVLEEAVEEARATPEQEIAGFMLGRLYRDGLTSKVFVTITGLASAGGTTEASETSVTYTPASFAHVREMIKLRGRDETVVGWYHSHPFKLCAECPLPTPPECIAKVLFYSQDDIHLMSSTFPEPFSLGLLVAVEPRIEQAVGHLPVKLYGWREGAIVERGFEVVGSKAE